MMISKYIEFINEGSSGKLYQQIFRDSREDNLILTYQDISRIQELTSMKVWTMRDTIHNITQGYIKMNRRQLFVSKLPDDYFMASYISYRSSLSGVGLMPIKEMYKVDGWDGLQQFINDFGFYGY